MIEKILGVFVYFEQYKQFDLLDEGVAPSMLVCNNSLETLVSSSNMPRLQVFLNSVNNKNDFRNTIWFGIVGDAPFNHETRLELSRERFKGNEYQEKPTINTIESISSLMHGINDYKIQVFFGFETCEETSFVAVAENGIDEYIDRTKILTQREYSEYIIPCLPNHTIVPQNKSGLILDKYMVVEDGNARISPHKDDLLKLWVAGVYIPASYIAAGLTSAYQCPEFLRIQFKKMVTKDYPGVRFDIEAHDHAVRIPTSLYKEIDGYDDHILEAIDDRSFGFVFSSDSRKVGEGEDEEDLNQITVLKARSLNLVENDYEHIYRTLTSTYITRVLRAQTNDNRHDSVVRFFDDRADSQKNLWLRSNEFVNSILLPRDTIGFEFIPNSDYCNVGIVFGGKQKNLEILLSRARP